MKRFLSTLVLALVLLVAVTAAVFAEEAIPEQARQEVSFAAEAPLANNELPETEIGGPAATVAEGTCGENVTWKLDADGVLTIGGSGAMNDYSSTYSNGTYRTTAPWGTYGASIKTVIIENGVTSIGFSAFSGCSSLTSVTIPSSVTSIGAWAFYQTPWLTAQGDFVVINGILIAYQGTGGDITIPNSVTSIGDDAFSSCSSLTSIKIPNSVTSIGRYAFSNCSSLTSVYITDLAAWCRISFSGASSGPLSYAHNLYLNGALVTDLVIPDSVTFISSYAFYGCSSLTSVTIPNSVTSIADNAFRDCSSLKSVTIGSSVTSIGSYAFDHCSSLMSVTIPSSVTAISAYAFSGCSSLTSVYITDLAAWCRISFSDIISNPLYYAHNLYLNGALVTDLVVPDSVTFISSCAFSSYSSLTSVTIPSSVTSIGNGAFSGCSSLTSVRIPDGVTVLEQNVFADCGSLTDVTLGEGVRAIERGAFSGCNNIQNVYYGGTQGQWKKVLIFGSEWLQNATITYNAFAGETEAFRIYDVAVTDALGNLQASVPTGKSRVSFTVSNLKANSGAKVMLACYDEAGQFGGVVWAALKNAPVGSEVTLTVPLDNTSGKIKKLKAFVVSEDGTTPQGSAVSFGE